MGMSTDAILVFGIDLCENGYCEEDITPPFLQVEDEDADELDFDDLLLRDAGLAPWGYDPDETKCEEYKVYSARREEARKLAGVELVWHCSGDYQMYILAVAGTEKRASRGYAVEISTDVLLMNQLEGIDKLRAFCKRHNIPWVQPRWLLCSYWG